MTSTIFISNLYKFLLFLGLAVVLLSILLFREIGYRGDKTNLKNVSSLEAFSMMEKDSEIVVIDIRTLDEFSRGHLTGAANIDFYSPDFNTIIRKLDKDTTYLIYCRTGNRSDKSLAVIKKLGFKNILHMYRRIAEWKNAGLPLEE